MTIPKLLLYSRASCPYCRRVTQFLAENNIHIEVKDVGMDKSAYQDMLQLSGTTQVPCLKIDNGFMLESLDIIDYLKKIYQK